jgi:hypothetical protein
MVAIFIESTGVHEKPKTMHVMEDGSAEHFKFLSRGYDIHGIISGH